MNPITCFAGCCACAANGQQATAPLTRVMNSLRRMLGRPLQDDLDYITGNRATCDMMSARGQKRKCLDGVHTSAWPHKRTSVRPLTRKVWLHQFYIFCA